MTTLKSLLFAAILFLSSANKPDALSFGVTKNGSIKIGTYFEQKEIECLKVFCTEAIKEIMWNSGKKEE